MAAILARRAWGMIMTAMMFSVGLRFRARGIHADGGPDAAMLHAMREAFRGEGDRHKKSQKATEEEAQELHHNGSI
jgi:hypothetical protein